MLTVLHVANVADHLHGVHDHGDATACQHAYRNDGQHLRTGHQYTERMVQTGLSLFGCCCLFVFLILLSSSSSSL